MKALVSIAVATIAFTAVSAAGSSLITLQTDRSSAIVSLDGARVVSFKTGGEEVLWSPKSWRYGGKEWAHGGIPVCWPWFGRSGPDTNVIHGFAWQHKFTVRNRKAVSGRSELVLGLTSETAKCDKWPYDFDLEYSIVLTDTLRLSLKTKNTGSKPFVLTTGLHPYFFIGDRDRTVVTGTDGLKYCDSRVTRDLASVWKGDLKLISSFDHVFVEPPGKFLHRIIDPLLDRTVTISASGAPRLVVWNPGVEEEAFGSPPPGALAVGDWRHLVCVEPAVLWKDAAIELKPGAVHELTAEISLGKGTGR